MKNIICIDLTKFNKDQLKRFCDINDFSYKPLLKLKLKTYAKLWIDSEGNCISFTLTEDNDFEIEDYDKMCLIPLPLALLSRQCNWLMTGSHTVAMPCLRARSLYRR